MKRLLLAFILLAVAACPLSAKVVDPSGDAIISRSVGRTISTDGAISRDSYKTPLVTYPLTLGAGESGGITINADGTESVGSNLVTDPGFDATTESNEYTSDFSAGVDSWTEDSTCTLAGNIDGIGGQDDNLRMTVDAGAATPRAACPTTLTVGNCYRIRFDYYLPSANSDVNGVKFDESGGGAVILANGTTTDAWTSVDQYVNSSGSGTLYLRAMDDGSTTTNDAGGDDVFYVRNVRIEAVTFTSWSAGAGWAPEASAGVLTGKAKKTAGTAGSLTQSGILTIGDTYRTFLEVSGYSAGEVSLFAGGSTEGTRRTADGSYLEDITCAGNDLVYIYANAAFAGTVDSTTFRQVTNQAQNGITVELDRVSGQVITSKCVSGTTTVLDASSVTYGAAKELIALHDADGELFVGYDNAKVYQGSVTDSELTGLKRHYSSGDGSGSLVTARIRYGAVENSGTSVNNQLYQIVTTEADHFAAGYTAGDYWFGDGVVTMDTNNTVKKVNP